MPVEVDLQVDLSDRLYKLLNAGFALLTVNLEKVVKQLDILTEKLNQQIQ